MAGTPIRLVALFCMLVCTGCGSRHDNRATITGEVTLAGQPIDRGSIEFAPMQGVEGSISSAEIVGGRYQLSGKTGPAVGWNRVKVHASRKTGKTIQRPFPQRGTMEETAETVAPRFNAQSTLKFEVRPGENTTDFDVASK
jgi:hypothetical protein